MSRVETFVRAREMLVGFRDECHPGCWVSCAITDISSKVHHDSVIMQMHDDALGVSVLVEVDGDKVEDAVARIAKEYGEKRTMKIEALRKALAVVDDASANPKVAESKAEEGEPE